MQNRFGLKDLVFLILLLVIGVSMWLNMFSGDRNWRKLDELVNQTETLERQNSALTQRVEQMGSDVTAISDRLSRGVTVNAGAGSNVGATGGTPAPTGGSGVAWAREGVEVTSFPRFAVQTDSRSLPNFAEGGEFVQIFEGQPSKITPMMYADVYGRYVTDEVVEGLGRYNPQSMTLEGVLAEAWQVDPAGLWLRVKIRDNARWSDGEPVTAEDYRWTYHDFLYDMEVQADRFRSVYQAIEQVTVVSEKVLEIRFKESRFDNVQQAVLMPVLPKHFYSRFTAAQINQATGLLMGSGPFKLRTLDANSQWAPPQDIVLVRNESYWGPKPALSGVRFKVVQDSLARLTTFTNREADMARPTSPQFEIKVNDPDFQSYARALEWYNVQGGWSFIAWQCGPRNGQKLTPFADQRVRLAMTHLIDRERIRRDINKNLARIATGPFSSTTPQADRTIEPWPYDEARAIALLEEAGWIDRNGDGVRENDKGEPFRFELTFGQGNDSTLQMVTYVKDQCAKVGIICDLNPIDWSVLQSILDRRDFDAATFAWSSSAPETDPTQLWAISSIEGTGDNFVQWRNEAADEAIKQGRRVINDEERMAYWHRLHRIIHEEQPYTPLMEVPWLRFVSNRIQNLQTYPMGMEMHEFMIPLGLQKSQ